MPKQPIKRPVVALDTSNQLGLFAMKGGEGVEDKAATRPKGVHFNTPDPRSILLNGVRLDEHLRRTGEKSALKVRQLLKGQSWLRFEVAYTPGGRPPYAPRAMVGLVLYGIMRGITSLRDLEQFARVDLGCMWVSGGILPDHSIIGRFIQRHADYLTEDFFVSLTRQVVKVTGSDTRTVSGDGTVIEAAASRYRVVKEEALKQSMEHARQAVAEAPQDEKQAQRLVQLQDAERVLQVRKAAKQAKGKNAERMQISPGEPEAVIQPLKDKKSFAPSYKPSVLANAVRVIVAQAVDASSETQVVAGMLEQAKAQARLKPRYLMPATIVKPCWRPPGNARSSCCARRDKARGRAGTSNQKNIIRRAGSTMTPNGTVTVVRKARNSPGYRNTKGVDSIPATCSMAARRVRRASSAVAAQKVPRGDASNGMRKMRQSNCCVTRWNSLKSVSVT